MIKSQISYLAIKNFANWAKFNLPTKPKETWWLFTHTRYDTSFVYITPLKFEMYTFVYYMLNYKCDKDGTIILLLK